MSNAYLVSTFFCKNHTTLHKIHCDILVHSDVSIKLVAWHQVLMCVSDVKCVKLLFLTFYFLFPLCHTQTYTHSDSECGRLSQESELDRQYESRARKGRSQEEHNGHSAR